MAKKKSKGSRKATVLTVKKIEELTLLDNIFMGEAFDDQIPLTQTALRRRDSLDTDRRLCQRLQRQIL